MENDFIITFQNTNYAMKAEKLLLDGDIRVGVLPLPSQISAGCGICLRLYMPELKSALSILGGGNAGKISVYSRTPENNRYIYSELRELSGSADDPADMVNHEQ